MPNTCCTGKCMRSVGTEGLRTRPAQTPHITALLTELIEAHLLAFELEPAAFLAVVPTGTMPSEVPLAVVEVLVLGHHWNWWLTGQVSELAIPVPESNRNEEQVDPGK